MKNISIKENNNILNYNDYRLSILITQSGLSYSIFNVAENKFVTLVSHCFVDKEKFIDEIKTFLINENINNKDFEKISILFASNKVTIVPNSLFDPQEAEKIFQLNFELSEIEKVLISKLHKSENTVIFSINKNLINLFDEIFYNYSIDSHSLPFIDNNFIKNKIGENNTSHSIFVQVFDEFIDILVFKDIKIQLYNTFKYKTSNDILYYIISVLEQLKLSQEKTKLSFSGFIETDNLSVINIKKFLNIVYFESLNTKFKYHYKLHEMAPHYYVNFLR